MAQYIDKATLIAEIENLRKHYIERDDYDIGWNFALDKILSFIDTIEDTIEVNEADLEKEFYDFLDTLIGKDNEHLSEGELFRIAEYFYELGLQRSMEKSDCICNDTSNNSQITIGTKIRLKSNPDIILSIISNDCHDDKFECSNGSVLSLKQIEKYYDIYIEEK